MAYTTGNVTVGKPRTSGSIFYGAAGSTLPTTADGTIGSTFSDLGYISEDGVTKATERESEELKAWGGDIVASPQTSFKDTFKFTLLETMNIEVLKAYYGSDNVTGTALSTGLTINANSTEAVEACWIIDQVMTGNTLSRICIPKGKITETGEVAYKDGEAVGFEITITAFPDTSGNTHYEYLKTATTSSASE